jgi:transposase
MEATKPSAEKVIKDIRRVTRKQYDAEEKIRIVLDGLRGEESLATLCLREGIAEIGSYRMPFLRSPRADLGGQWTLRTSCSGPMMARRAPTKRSMPREICRRVQNESKRSRELDGFATRRTHTV